MNRRDFLKSAAALAGSVALPAPVASSEIVLNGTTFSASASPEAVAAFRALLVSDLACEGFLGFSFRMHSEKPRVIDYVEPDRLIYRGRRGVNVPAWYEPEREYLGVR